MEGKDLFGGPLSYSSGAYSYQDTGTKIAAALFKEKMQFATSAEG